MHRMNAIELDRLAQTTWDEGRQTQHGSWHGQNVYQSDLFRDVWLSCVMGVGLVAARSREQLKRKIDWAVFCRGLASLPVAPIVLDHPKEGDVSEQRNDDSNRLENVEKVHGLLLDEQNNHATEEMLK